MISEEEKKAIEERIRAKYQEQYDRLMKSCVGCEICDVRGCERCGVKERLDRAYRIYEQDLAALKKLN